MTRCVCALGPRVLGSAVPTRAAPRGIARNVHVTWTLRRKMSRQHSRKAKAGCRVVVEAALPDEISGLTYVSPASSRAAASQTSGNPAVSQLALGSLTSCGLIFDGEDPSINGTARCWGSDANNEISGIPAGGEFLRAGLSFLSRVAIYFLWG